MAYKVTDIDNRGYKDRVWGFVYITNGKINGRIGFGSHRDDPRPLAIWQVFDTPKDFTTNDYETIKLVLNAAFPHLADLAAYPDSST